MTKYPWQEKGMPSPFPGGEETGKAYWIPSPVAELLRDLNDAGRWPDAVAEDSWTGEITRLRAWADYIREVRAYAIAYYGRGSGQYADVKSAFGAAVSLMYGERAREGFRRVHHCRNARTDWAMCIAAQEAASLWRVADKTKCAVALESVDSLIIPASEFEKLTGDGGPIRLDDSGVTFGTFKVERESE
jgi:hypothetical protein